MAPILLRIYKFIDNIHLEGTMPQNLYLGLGLNFMLKKGKLLVFVQHYYLDLS